MSVQRPPRTCLACGFRFTPAGPDQQYCSQRCEGRAVLAEGYAAAA